ncbi:FAD dependent oxidoreductase [Rhodotorula toruloides]|uniref:FAD dependent oxidoreductase n=1 Tax=Rhodotorula toruloides TaxID=5286 RepID=A0A511KNH9_RHOTO|nr:FAD dependent oxidoreductase [Rhodotorula toruloides]
MSSPRHIGIVGGGIIGSSTAFWTARLARERSLPVNITLFEGSSVAAGASGKAGGLLALDWHGPATASLAALSYRLHSELAAEYGGTDRWGYRRLDTLSVSADLSSSSSSSAKLSSRSKKLKGADLFPWLNKGVLTASEVLGNQETTSQVHPEQFTRAMVEEAEKLGVKVVYGSVEGAQARADGGYDLSITPRDSAPQDRSTVPVTDVVVTAGPWTGKLLSKLGLDKQAGRAKAIKGSRAHSIVLKTAPGRDLPAQALFTSIKEVGGRHAEPEVYNRPDGTSYICGPTDSSSLPTLASSVTTESSAIDLLISQAARLAPDYLSTDNGQYSATVERRQACYLPVGSGDPVIGKIAQGAYVASGHSCWGICNGPGTGYVMAELLLDGKVKSADIDDLGP